MIDNPKLEKIFWDDAGGFLVNNETWSSKEAIVKAYHNAGFSVTSVGHLLHEDKDSVLIAQSHDEHYDQYANPLRIPKKMIKGRLEL